MPFTVYDHGLGFYVLELRQGGLEMKLHTSRGELTELKLMLQKAGF